MTSTITFVSKAYIMTDIFYVIFGAAINIFINFLLAKPIHGKPVVSSLQVFLYLIKLFLHWQLKSLNLQNGKARWTLKTSELHKELLQNFWNFRTSKSFEFQLQLCGGQTQLKRNNNTELHLFLIPTNIRDLLPIHTSMFPSSLFSKLSQYLSSNKWASGAFLFY